MRKLVFVGLVVLASVALAATAFANKGKEGAATTSGPA